VEWVPEAMVQLLTRGDDGGTSAPAEASSRSRVPQDREALPGKGGREVMLGGPRDPDAILVVSGAPGADTAGELSASGADLIVLVVPKGLRAAELQASIEVLATLRLAPGWGLLVGEEYGRLFGAREPSRPASSLEAAP
jgi:hypothetical protein